MPRKCTSNPTPSHVAEGPHALQGELGRPFGLELHLEALAGVQRGPQRPALADVVPRDPPLLLDVYM